MGRKVQAQWEMYTDDELAGGAKRNGLTVVQERQRLRIVQSEFRQWPIDLLAYVKEQHSTGLEFVGFTVIQRSVINWLLKNGNGNTIPMNTSVTMKVTPDMAVAA